MSPGEKAIWIATIMLLFGVIVAFFILGTIIHSWAALGELILTMFYEAVST